MMQMRRLAPRRLPARWFAVAWCALAAGYTAWESGGTAEAESPRAATASSDAASQGPMARGLKVTFETLRGDKVVHSQRARLLSLGVERGESPTPFLPPGGFRATYRGVVTLAARDRMNFRIEGRGGVTLKIDGETVLSGQLDRRSTLETEKAVRLRKGGNDLELVFESGARGDGQLRVFWSGLDFGFEPILPELLSHPENDEAVARGEQLRLGHQLFVERRCARCHEYAQLRVAESAYRELDRAGPDLRRVGSRVQPAFLASWMRDPHAIRPEATMPSFGLTEKQANNVAAWLAGLGEPLPHGAFTDGQRQEGAVRFRELGCVACHIGPGEPAATHGIGARIDLAFVPEKWHAAALVAYLQDPSAHYDDVRMPNLKVSPEDAERLAAHLLAGAQPVAAPSGDAAEGRRLVQRHGCVVCHALPDDVPPADRVFPRFVTLKPERGCLADGDDRGDAPQHNLDDSERAALRAFLPFGEEVPFRRAPTDFIARHLEAERCVACHAIDGQPSTWARLTEDWSKGGALPAEQDPVAQGVPSLTWVGAKLQPSWLSGFVRGEKPSPRPWLTARMPKFERHGDEIAKGLVREHGYDDRDEPIRQGDANLAVHGQRLLAMGTGFGCVQCHAVGDQKATQVFEREGINLVTARQRLRHEYYTRWLADPPRLDPEARMPKYADTRGKTAFTDVLDGDAAQQFEAIWQYLGGLAR